MAEFLALSMLPSEQNATFRIPGLFTVRSVWCPLLQDDGSCPYGANWVRPSSNCYPTTVK